MIRSSPIFLTSSVSIVGIYLPIKKKESAFCRTDCAIYILIYFFGKKSWDKSFDLTASPFSCENKLKIYKYIPHFHIKFSWNSQCTCQIRCSEYILKFHFIFFFFHFIILSFDMHTLTLYIHRYQHEPVMCLENSTVILSLLLNYLATFLVELYFI